MKVHATVGSGDLILMGLIVLLLAGLPLVVWLDVRNLTEKALLRLSAVSTHETDWVG